MTKEYPYNHMQPWTSLLILDIAKSRTRADVAWHCAKAMRIAGHEGIDWPEINSIIKKRWCTHALSYIKTKAWAILEEQKAPK